MPVPRRTFPFPVSSLVLFLLCVAGAARAQTPVDAAAQLAGKVVAGIGPNRTVVLKVRNLSSLGTAQLAEFRRTLENELASHGMRPAQGAEGIEVEVTVSENLRGYLAVLQVRSPQEEAPAFVRFDRPERVSAAPPAETLQLEKQLVWEQAAPMLDFARFRDAGGTELLLLVEPGRVSLREKKDNGWRERGAASLRSDLPWPRDLRGRLLVEGDTFWVYLPGVVCGGLMAATEGASITADCRSSEDPWPLTAGPRVLAHASFAPRGNSFDGRIHPENGESRTVPPFFSAAAFELEGKTSWLLAGTDGQARLLNSELRQDAVFDGWGSDLASVKTDCGSGWQILVTAAGEASSADSLRAVEVKEDQAATRAALGLSGPVTALWPGNEEGTATVITRNLETRRYEAHVVNAACRR